MPKPLKVSLECYVWRVFGTPPSCSYLVQNIGDERETEFLLTPLFGEFERGQKVRITVEAIE